jgi:hypothetical protein
VFLGAGDGPSANRDDLESRGVDTLSRQLGQHLDEKALGAAGAK